MHVSTPRRWQQPQTAYANSKSILRAAPVATRGASAGGRLRSPATPQPTAAPAAATPADKGAFRFRHFVVRHDKCAQKVGTDAMLLGSWAAASPAVSAAARLLDVGTGTGVLALMLAQQAPPFAQIDAIDIDAAACEQAADNAGGSQWRGRIRVRNVSVQQLATEAAAAALPSSSRPPAQPLYDVVVSNPPFFTGSTPPRGSSRAAARHADHSLSFGDLCTSTAALLAPGGSFFVVLPADQFNAFLVAAGAAGLKQVRVLRVFTRPGNAQPKRVLLELHGSTAPATKAAPDSADLFISGVDAAGTAGAAAADDSRRRRVSPSLSRGSSFSRQYVELTQSYHHPDYFGKV